MQAVILAHNEWSKGNTGEFDGLPLMFCEFKNSEQSLSDNQKRIQLTCDSIGCCLSAIGTHKPQGQNNIEGLSGN